MPCDATPSMEADDLGIAGLSRAFCSIADDRIVRSLLVIRISFLYLSVDETAF